MSQVRRDMLEHMSTEAERFQGPNKKVKYEKIDVRDIETSGEASAKPCRGTRQQVVKLAGPQTLPNHSFHFALETLPMCRALLR